LRTFDLTSSKETIANYLRERHWLGSKESILTLEKPGEGNMNVVLRIKTDSRSVILKQSRPYVQKYQEIEAPLERIALEYEFYQSVRSNALKMHLPEVLGFDGAENILLLEDLGDCEDMTSIYRNRSIPTKQVEKLVFILGLIHRKKVSDDFPQNLKMRRLNHQHIFVLPFLEENGFSLDTVQPGLQKLSWPYKQDEALKSIVHRVGEKYLSKGDTLLHGDYYPGSWMTEVNNLYVIDPEFGFVGFAEFDLGVMAAHLILATGKIDLMNQLQSLYDGPINDILLRQVAGIEIMRRLIGLAQLPLERTIEEKQYLLRTAHELILS
jgi:5-methylthioribose kinase